MCTVATGLTAVMYALPTMTRLMVGATSVAQRLHVPGFLFHKGVFAAACVARPARNEQAEDREHQ